jgi:hypothetical protein
MHKSATKCNETLGKWRKNKHGASKIIDTLETYHSHITGLRPNKSTRGSCRSSASPRGFESGDSNLSKLTDVFAAMQLTGTRCECQTAYANPSSNQTMHFRGSKWVLLELTTLLNESFAYLLCFSRYNIRDMCSQGESQIRVPAIVFDYPRHSGATDEGIPNGPLVLAYLVSVQKGQSSKVYWIPWRYRLGAAQRHNLACKMKTRRRRPSRIRTRLGFIQTNSICNRLGEQSRDPTFAYKRLGGRS